MKINALTTNFTGSERRTQKSYSTKSRCNHNHYDYNYTHQLTQDEINLKRKARAAERKKQEKTKNQVIGASKLALGMALIKLATQVFSPDPLPMLDGHGNNLEEAANFMDAPVKIVEMVNDADRYAVLDQYIIPQEYNGFDTAIEECKEELKDEDLSTKKRIKLEAKLEDLEERKAKLEEMGEVWIDPKTDEAYIVLNDSYSAEDVKDVLGIKKDGEFRDDTSFRWNVGGPDGRGFRDYSDSSLCGIVDCDADVLNPRQQ
ncbi:MAG: hypothetical protein IJD57_08185 [Candidatus Gastranaerophilales bacterium]|nr:hypothetical protein [Candidatus Gastranaerophilales bacterium]